MAERKENGSDGGVYISRRAFIGIATVTSAVGATLLADAFTDGAVLGEANPLRRGKPGGPIAQPATPAPGQGGTNPLERIFASPVPTETPTPKPSPTPDYKAMANSNFDQIDRAEDGQEIRLTNVVIHGFERITLSFPGTNIQSAEDAAFTARIGPDGQNPVYVGYALGARCLLDVAQNEGLLEGVAATEFSQGNVTRQIWVLNTPLVIPELRVIAGDDIPGSDGGKVLDVKGYYTVKSDVENLCDRSTNVVVYNTLKGAFLLSEKARVALHGPNQPTPSATPVPQE
jgi:hypothetical protein